MAELGEDLRALFVELGVPGAGGMLTSRAPSRTAVRLAPASMAEALRADSADTTRIIQPQPESRSEAAAGSLRELFERLRSAG